MVIVNIKEEKIDTSLSFNMNVFFGVVAPHLTSHIYMEIHGVVNNVLCEKMKHRPVYHSSLKS